MVTVGVGQQFANGMSGRRSTELDMSLVHDLIFKLGLDSTVHL